MIVVVASRKSWPAAKLRTVYPRRLQQDLQGIANGLVVVDDINGRSGGIVGLFAGER